MSIYRCHVRDLIWKIAKFQVVKNKAHVNAFLYSDSFSYLSLLLSFCLVGIIRKLGAGRLSFPQKIEGRRFCLSFAGKTLRIRCKNRK